MNTDFGNRLMGLRKSEGLTRDELAHELNMSVNTLRNYENGSREPGHSFVIQMAKRFHVTTDFILGVSSKMEKSPAPAKAETRESLDEKRLVTNYHDLNKEGKQKLLCYSDDLISSGNYAAQAEEA